MRPALVLLAASTLLAQSQPGWWMTEPVRWLQTNLRETDAAVPPAQLVDFLAGYNANVLHINVGGIAAFYPSKLPLHTVSPHLPQGRDLIGDAVRLAHSRRIRVVGRFDFSKTPKPAFDAHPEWYFRTASGEPVVFNGLYSTCINGGYYSDYAMRILAEALDNYELDGLFFNMFGNQSRDYAGRFVGHCHCNECQRLFRARYNRPLPAEPDDDYRQFMFDSSRRVAAEIGKLIHSKRPSAGYFNYIQEHTDGIMSESNTALPRPLPLWPYASSLNVNRARNSQPSKMSVNLCMQFVDYPWRFATVPAHEIALRLWQNVAHGGALALAINGTPEQQDRQALEAARPIFAWTARNERYFAGQQSAAKVLLLGNAPENSLRGIFRILTEQHIPFAVSDNLDWIGKRNFDLVISAGRAPRQLQPWLEKGGRLLVASAQAPEFPAARIVKSHPNIEGYLRVRNHAQLPSLALTNLLLLNGPFLETEPESPSALTLVPPSMIGPPEKIHIDQTDTAIPGLITKNVGQGSLAWLPFDLGALYHRLSLPAHAGLIADVIDSLLPGGRQLKTNAHPLVEITLMRKNNSTQLHLINLSGHSVTAYHAPLPIENIELTVEGQFTSARTLRAPAGLRLRRTPTHTTLTLPRLQDYELIVLD